MKWNSCLERDLADITPFSAVSHGIGSGTPAVILARSACSQSDVTYVGVLSGQVLVSVASCHLSSQTGVCPFNQARS
jgi:hypothetical protein